MSRNRRDHQDNFRWGWELYSIELQIGGVMDVTLNRGAIKRRLTISREMFQQIVLWTHRQAEIQAEDARRWLVAAPEPGATP